MLSFARSLRWVRGRGSEPTASSARATDRSTARQLHRTAETPRVDIAPNDPLVMYLMSAPGPVALDGLQLDSPALRDLRAAGVKLVVPLVSQGELIGTFNLGPHLSDQEYSVDDRRLLDKLAAQAAPALRVAQLVREQEAEVRARERLEQELRLAHLIQQQFLPRKVPDLPGWQVAAFYRPARQVGGDFYDFIDLADGQIGLVVGDVTGHGVPAALVMATTRSAIRSEAPRLVAPGAVLARVNELLHGDMPSNMFVTCLFALLDPVRGRLRFANAGHDLPYVRRAAGVVELRATGMPLGIMADSRYAEAETILAPGEGLLLHSDGLAEAHAPDHAMFGFPRLRDEMGRHQGGQPLIDGLLEALDRFTGPGWAQEDDITLVTLTRSARSEPREIASFAVPSRAGNERVVMDRVAEAIAAAGIDMPGLARIKTAVGEAAMNAIEHGNRFSEEVPVGVQVLATDDEVLVRITDNGGDRAMPEPSQPDLEAKLAGKEKPRGWGLFLIKNMVDDVNVRTDGPRRVIELVARLKGGRDGDSGRAS